MHGPVYCQGCDKEFQDCIILQDEGYFLATSKDVDRLTGKHFFGWMVNDAGYTVYQ